jgi:hypothetical protein
MDAIEEIRRPKRGQVVNDEFYERVAVTYRQAVAAGRKDPTKAVAETHYGSPSSAGRWVMKARELGYLGKTARGVAGEITTQPARRRKKGGA